MKLQLPQITLIVTDTRCHELMRRTTLEMLKAVEFGSVVVCTDNPKALHVPGALTVPVWDWGSKLDWERFIWEKAPAFCNTDHAMFMEWDAGLVDVGSWQPIFATFDYIGAPWWYSDGLNVGNGGLSMRSRELMRFLTTRADAFPVLTPGDDALCRKYRRRLETIGARWAPEAVAADFSFECNIPPQGKRTFGYHAMRNWPRVLGREELLERTRLAEANPYVAKTDMMQQLYSAAPWLRDAAAA